MSTAWFLLPIAWVLWKAWRIAYPQIRVRLEWKPTDLWIGLFWKATPQFDGTIPNGEWIDVWVCLLPMLPIHLDWPQRRRQPQPDSN